MPNNKTSSWFPDLDRVSNRDGSLPFYWVNQIAERAEEHLIDGKPFTTGDREAIERLLEHPRHKGHQAFEAPLKKALNFVNQGLGQPEASASPAQAKPNSRADHQLSDSGFGFFKTSQTSAPINWTNKPPLIVVEGMPPIPEPMESVLRAKMDFTDAFVKKLGASGPNGLPPEDVQKIEALYQEFMPEIYERQIGQPGANVTRDKLDGEFGRSEYQQLRELRSRINEDLHRVKAGKRPRHGDGSPRAEEERRIAKANEDLKAAPLQETAKPVASEHQKPKPSAQGQPAQGAPVEDRNPPPAAAPPATVEETPVAPADGNTVPQTQDAPLTEGNQSGILSRTSEIDGPRDYLRDLDSEQVKEMQRVLGVDDDGKWGEKTMAAAKAYIAENNLPQNTTLADLQKHMQGVEPTAKAQQGYDEDRATHYAREAAKMGEGVVQEEFEAAHGKPAPEATPKPALDTEPDPTPPPSTDPVVRMA